MKANHIRQQLRQTRRQLTKQQQQQHAQNALDHLLKLMANSDAFKQSQKIAFFLAQDGELSTQAAIEYLWQNTQHEIYLPVLETLPNWHMGFVRYTEDSEMINNRFDIPEPKTALQDHLSGEQMDWVFMPLVGFDQQGNRLGMGGGYYDRSFAFKKGLNPSAKQTQLYGWAHSCQQVEQLPAEPWDVPLDGLIHENGIVHFQHLD